MRPVGPIRNAWLFVRWVFSCLFILLASICFGLFLGTIGAFVFNIFTVFMVVYIIGDWGFFAVSVFWGITGFLIAVTQPWEISEDLSWSFYEWKRWNA